MWAAHDAETEALDTLIWTQPTTIAGVLALLELWPELPHIDADQANTLIISVVDALRDLHPNARSVEAAGHAGKCQQPSA